MWEGEDLGGRVGKHLLGMERGVAGGGVMKCGGQSRSGILGIGT